MTASATVTPIVSDDVSRSKINIQRRAKWRSYQLPGHSLVFVRRMLDKRTARQTVESIWLEHNPLGLARWMPRRVQVLIPLSMVDGPEENCWNAERFRYHGTDVDQRNSPLIKSNPSMRGATPWATFPHSNLYAVCLKRFQEFINGLLRRRFHCRC
jgi:hypothetical protein